MGERDDRGRLASYGDRDVILMDRSELLTALVDSYEMLRGPLQLMRDWPPDTVLGESGVQAIEQLDKATTAIDCYLANYPDWFKDSARWQVERKQSAEAKRARLKLKVLRRGKE